MSASCPYQPGVAHIRLLQKLAAPEFTVTRAPHALGQAAMLNELTINDFLDKIRMLLADDAEKATRTIRTIERKEASSGISGNLIVATFDAAKDAFEASAITVFRALRQAQTTALPREALREATVSELQNYLNRVKAIVNPDRFKAQFAGNVGLATEIDRRLNDLDTRLRLMIRQMDVGLLDLGDDPNPNISRKPQGNFEVPFGEGVFAEGAPPKAVAPASLGPKAGVVTRGFGTGFQTSAFQTAPAVDELPESGVAREITRTEQAISQSPAEFENLARSLAKEFDDEVERLLATKSNLAPEETDRFVEFLKRMSRQLNNLADTIALAAKNAAQGEPIFLGDAARVADELRSGFFEWLSTNRTVVVDWSFKVGLFGTSALFLNALGLEPHAALSFLSGLLLGSHRK